MVEIMRRGGVSMQVFSTARSLAVPNGSSVVTDLNLNRAGRYLGGSGSADCPTNVTLGVTLRNVDDTPLSYGDQVSQIRVVVRNATGGAADIGHQVVLFIGVSGN